MPELSRAETVSRSAFLELQDELRLVKDGYEFLDEKRILLASEMLRQRAAYCSAREAFTELCDTAAEAVRDAAADQGLDGLQVHPAMSFPDARLHLEERPYVGQTMLEAHFDAGKATISRRAIRPSPEVGACISAFQQIIVAAAPLAAMATNLKRLMHEYRRTERRVRALENVVLPEIRQDLATMDEHLNLNEQEEVIRVRSARIGTG